MSSPKAALWNINGSYLLEMEGWSEVTVEIDGKRVKKFKKGWLPEKPSSVVLVQQLRRVVRYGELEPGDYESQRDALVPSRDEDDMPVFPNVDAEYAFKKFIEGHPPVHEDYEQLTDVELVEHDITGVTDHPFIKPFRLVGKPPVVADRVLYEYVPDPYELARLVAAEFELQEVDDASWGAENTKGAKWSVPSHSRNTLRFLKVNGDYAAGDGCRFNGIIAGSFEECRSRYEEHLAVVRELFAAPVRKMRAVGKSFDRATVIRRLEHIGSMVAKIDAKRASDLKPGYVANQINKFARELGEAA